MTHKRYKMKKLLNVAILVWGIVLGGATSLWGAVVNITEGSSSGYTMTDGNTYVVQNSVAFLNSTAGGSGMTVEEGASVVLYVPAGVQLITTGTAGSGKTGGGAGIRVPETSTLVITGEGTIYATGGNAAKGGNGATGEAGSTPTANGSGTSGAGGAGGNGGGGGGAAIGGVGGTGGDSGSGATGITRNNTSLFKFYGNGNVGNAGQKGSAGESMGNVYLLGNVHLMAIMGSLAEGGTAGNYGKANWRVKNTLNDGYWAFLCSGGGGGGGGGAGCLPSHAIGGGGASGGGGGGGGSGSLHCVGYWTSLDAIPASPTKNTHGGGGTGGQIKGQTGETNLTYSFWGTSAQGDYKVAGGRGGGGGAAGSAGGMGTLWVSPTASVNVERETSPATTYSAAEYAITFDANGGQFTTSVDSLTATLGCELPDCIPAPTRSQHLFMGWKTADGVEYYGADGSKSIASYPVVGDVTLYAQWAVNGQTIDFPEIEAQVATNTVTLGATASSGLEVSYAVEGPALLDGAVLSFTGAGTVTVTASQEGDDVWAAAENVVRSFVVTKALAEVVLGDLEQVYDTQAHRVGVETLPEGLGVAVTYDGSEEEPVGAGSYGVVATVVDDVWEGSAEGTLVVSRGTQTIAFAEMGEQLAPTVVELGAVASSGLAVEYAAEGPVVLEGSKLSFTGVGTVTVVASQPGDANWEAAEDVVRSFQVVKGTAEVTLGGLSQAYDGASREVSVETVPEGLSVLVTYDGAEAAPTNTGSYGVVATVVDDRWEGSAAGTLVVSKGAQSIEFAEIGSCGVTERLALSAEASSGLAVTFAVVSGPALLEGGTLRFAETGTVTVAAMQFGDANWLAAETVVQEFAVVKSVAQLSLEGLEQAFDGTGKTVSVATVPEGLAVVVTYDGEEAAPTNAGCYAVSAVVEDAKWEGSAEGTLVIARGGQSIEFPEIGVQTVTNEVTLGAVASSGLGVSYEVEGPAVLEENVLTFTGVGEVTVTASQAGDANWEAAESVSVSFEVGKATALVTLGRLAQAYDGGAKAASVETVPAGLAVTVTYDGSEEAPVGAGSYSVEAVVEDAMWKGSATGTLEIAKGAQSIVFEAIGAQVATNVVTLGAVASSGLGVAYAVEGGAGWK